jgi:UDP-4-amino-4,6-dideoxy-N-acetyl-beta-L-altrosamine transaminase
MIPYGRQDIAEADIQAVVEVLRSDWLTQGPTVPAFEKAVAEHCGAGYAVAVNSGTSALHLACIALGVGPGDWVWTSPNSFVASANCARYCGASVDFVDIDPETYNLCPRQLATKLEQAERASKLPKVVIPVHFGGQSCDMSTIHDLAERYRFRVIEDASHAIGGRYRGSDVGGCAHSDITVFSFHPVKVITSGEGGMALTRDAMLAQRMALLRTHGITREQDTFRYPAAGPWCYEQQDLGFNYRMTDIHAVLGLSQLSRLNSQIARRNALARRYDAALGGLPLRLPNVAPEVLSSFHLYVVRLRRDAVAKTHRQVFDELRRLGIGVNVHYTPIHLQPYYRELGFRSGQFPHAEAHAEEAITLPLYSALKEREQDLVIAALKHVVGNA